MNSCSKLEVQFDPARLLEDLGRIAPGEWTRHYNTNDYEGEWTGVALRAVEGRGNSLFVDPSPDAVFADTEVLERCPSFREVLAWFRCPLKTARLLKLGAGAVILEHRDPGFGIEEGEVRIHVPLATNPGVEFYLDGRRRSLNPGEAWYLDFSRPHRIRNRGTTDRVHLVIDCVVNDWLRSQLARLGEGPEPSEAPAPALEAGEPRGGFEEFREHVLDDVSILEPLAETADRELFSDLVARLGRERGYEFAASDVGDTLRRRPLWGTDHSPAREVTPPAGWIPIGVEWGAERPAVDWCHLGAGRFTEPFFTQTVSRCVRRPVNQLFRLRTPLEGLPRLGEERPGLAPAGFLFHMSRCGSTLVAQQLATLSRTIVISEASPIDLVLRGHHFAPGGLDDASRIALLKAMIAALGQPRSGGETHLIVKFDSWHARELPLIREAFPDVPWIFVYREPVEVLVSQLKHRGINMIAGVGGPGLSGLDDPGLERRHPEEYCARVLAEICESALESLRQGPGFPLDYRRLPDATLTRVLDAFGIVASDSELEAMRGVSQFYAKEPSFYFEDDTEAKRREASEEVRRVAERWLRPLHDELRAIEAERG